MWRGRITWSVRRATADRAAHRRDVSRVASLSLERDDGLLHRVNFARLLLVLLLDVQVLLLHLLMRRLSLLPQLPLVLGFSLVGRLHLDVCDLHGYCMVGVELSLFVGSLVVDDLCSCSCERLR